MCLVEKFVYFGNSLYSFLNSLYSFSIRLDRYSLHSFLGICLLLVQTEGLAETRIINGTCAADEWPWMAAIVYPNRPAIEGQYCGGALIHPSWILTAAHCTDGEDTNSIAILLGRNTLSDEGTGELIGIKNIVKHPDYDHDPENPAADLALLQLEKPYTQAAVLRVAEAYSDVTEVGKLATVIGWSQTSTKMRDSYADSLQQTAVPIVSNQVCNARRTYDGEVKDTMLCAGFAGGGTDACVGDSGGPFVMETDAGWQQIGIVSWGEGCARPYYYGVYTRVSSYQEFISEHVCEAQDTLPAPQVEVSINGQKATVSWNNVIGADGYQFYYAPYSDSISDVTFDNIHSLDIKNDTDFSAELSSGENFYVAAKAYRGNCYSDYSNIGMVIMP